MSWEAPEDNGSPIHHYILQLAEEGEAFHGVEYEGEERTYCAVGMDTGVTYRVRVQAVNAEGPSPFSAIHAVCTLAGKPDAPSGLTVVSTSPRMIKIKWRKANSRGSAVVNYNVRWDSGEDHGTVSISGSTTNCKLSKLAPNTEHTICVSAVSMKGESETCAPVSVHTEPEIVSKSPTETITHENQKLETSITEEDQSESRITRTIHRKQKIAPERQRNFAHLKQKEDEEVAKLRRKIARESGLKYKLGQLLQKVDSIYLASGFVLILVVIMVLNSGNEGSKAPSW